jgi:hypothetical protein
MGYKLPPGGKQAMLAGSSRLLQKRHSLIQKGRLTSG